jgi:hypothetical protein
MLNLEAHREGEPAMYDVTTFPLRDLTACSAALRRMSAGAANLEDAAQALVQHLYEELRDGRENNRICVLARFFVTRPFARLDPEQQDCARQLLSGEPALPSMKCLVLMGTAGVQPQWNDRRTSAGHRAIPLASEAMVQRSPMISQLVSQFGLEACTLIAPDPRLLVDLEQRSYNVFHVMEALHSPYVPAQGDFVAPFGIRSVVGFGGLLPSGNLFAVILFTRIPIPRETADLFRPLALSVKLAILPFENGQEGARPPASASKNE